jgi:single-stranded-DNA-specific exonuclease
VTDGTLTPQDLSMALAEGLEAGGPWGQGFSEPLFEGAFFIASCRIVGENHLKLVLRPDDSQQLIDAIAFRVETPEAWQEGAKIKAAYRLEVNEFRSIRTPQLLIEYMTTALN